MSISQNNTATIVCREVFDETSHPSNEEVLEYAKKIGIDPETEPHLMDIAIEGLMAPLPKNWTPCYDKSERCYYYCNSTKASTWEHPLDSKYRELVEHIRAGHSRQPSIDDDSKTTAKELESHEDATLPKESTLSKVPVLYTKIPKKLAPLRKFGIDTIMRRKDCEKINDTSIQLADRSSRDYTTIRYQDPKFFETPAFINNNKEIKNISDIVKRSESMSPKYEKDWEQLTNKFSSEENIIDIDKLSLSSLSQTDGKDIIDTIDKERQSRKSDYRQQKELTLSGGGFMFLKSNRSRDNTPVHDDAGKIEDFQISCSVNEGCCSIERPKSILREKPCEDDDRPTEEERKSVRFDLEKDPDNNMYVYSGSEDEDWDSDSEEKEVTSDHGDIKSSFFEKLQKNPLQSPKSNEQHYQQQDNQNIKSSINTPSTSKLICKRFVVESVSETDHLCQSIKDKTTDNDYLPNNKFVNIKNIDLFSKSDTDSGTPRSSKHDESNSSNLDNIRKSKEIMLEAMSLTDERKKIDKLIEKQKNDNLIKLRHDLEIVDNHVRNRKGHNEKNQKHDADDDDKNYIDNKYDNDVEKYKKEIDDKLEMIKKQMDDKYNEEKVLLENELDKKLSELRKEFVAKENDEIQKLITTMDDARMENLKKAKIEWEVCFDKERQEIFEKLKLELDERKNELLKLRNHEMEILENEFGKNLDDEIAFKTSEHKILMEHNEKIENLKKELDNDFDDLKNKLRIEQREKVTQITDEHEKCLAEILRDFRTEERLARKVYKQRLEEIRADFSQGIDKEAKKMSEHATRQETVDFEKMRCEKRLLEDKYKILKDKYLKLKNDVRLAVERRSKRKEAHVTTSETEKSASTRTKTDRTESMDRKAQPIIINTKQRPGDNQFINTENNSDSIQLQRFQTSRTSCGDSRSSIKFESDDATTASETMNSNVIKKRRSFARKSTNNNSKISQNDINNINNNNNNNSNNIINNNPENPVENIRKQLEKLEDLGDQLPSNDAAYTLRYPFQDKGPMNASSELEFFRHRIHVERDSVKRARDALRVQKNVFQGRQRAWKQKSARATLEQLVMEERELSEMEVSLHRTRSLLGEKVIHLRHLEQSLDRVTNNKKNEDDISPVKSDELTLSDMSSASSGFSSTDLDKPDNFQESSEIINSLENLNSEIREIWGVLNKRQGNNIPPPPTLSYSDLGWLSYHPMTNQSNNLQAFGTPNIQSNILSQLATLPSTTTTTQNIIAQYGPASGFTTSMGNVERGPSNLIERTRNMRDWLRQARIETSDLISPNQAPL